MDSFASSMDFKVGDKGTWQGIHGSVSKIENNGATYHFTTPGGSTLKMGFVWFAKDFIKETTNA